ncbi:MAG: glycosyltransferase family 9 protein [Kiritimatiellia bacterium]|nr:glycosyltransferase family 9 protein [Kiritimatiellia bacterium]
MSRQSAFHNPKILVFRGGALGDFMLTLPALLSLRLRWPKAYIELIGHENNTGLALTTGIIDHLQSLDSARMALYFQTECALPPDEHKYIASFDLVVSYLHDPDGVLRHHLKEAGAKNIAVVSPLVSKSHAADHFFSGLKSILGDEIKKCPPARLAWPAQLSQAARKRLRADIGKKQIIIIHPGSGSPAKNWPVEKFTRLAKKIRTETRFEPLIIGGEAEASEITALRPLLPDFHIFDNLPLPDVASILSVASGFVGNDSGLTHLAAALGIPVIALFGPTDPAVWGPRGDKILIIRSRRPTTESLAKIGVEFVFQAISALKMGATRPL